MNDSTIAYYDEHAERFVEETVNADLSALYRPFQEHIPVGGIILDAGCGSGRDSRYFLERGYRVEPFDASGEMCRLASKVLGQTVHQKRFEDVDYVAAFDGIWASASLLHVPRSLIDDVLAKLYRALKPDGMMFASFKYRNEEWVNNGRFFNGYDEKSFTDLLNRHPVICHSMWISEDVRPERKHEKWLNVLLRHRRT